MASMIGKDWRDEPVKLDNRDNGELPPWSGDSAVADEPLIVGANGIPHGDVTVQSGFIIPPDKLKFTAAGEWKYEWVSYPEKHRFQILIIPRRDLLAIITGKARITNIPEGATIDAIADDFHRDAISVRVSHPSFDAVPPGQEYKRLVAEYEDVK